MDSNGSRKPYDNPIATQFFFQATSCFPCLIFICSNSTFSSTSELNPLDFFLKNLLLKYCLNKGIEAKVHYPKPLYLQEAYKKLKYKKGDFPITDIHTKKIITFPCDQHLSKREVNFVIKTVKDFYEKK